MEESGTADAMEGGWETASIVDVVNIVVAVVVDVDVGDSNELAKGVEKAELDAS